MLSACSQLAGEPPQRDPQPPHSPTPQRAMYLIPPRPSCSIPLWGGVLITIVDTFFFLFLDKYGECQDEGWGYCHSGSPGAQVASVSPLFYPIS